MLDLRNRLRFWALVGVFFFNPFYGFAFEESKSECDALWMDIRGVYKSSSFYEFFARQVSENVRGADSRQIPACLRNVNEIDKINNLLIVDVRSSEEFNRGHIPDSVNLPLYQLKTKNTFKNRPILIVDEGKRYLDNLSMCDTLPLQGFLEVYLLEGGYGAWVRAHIEKDKAEYARTISSNDFIAISEKKAWVVLDFSGRENTFPEHVFQFDIAKFDRRAGLESLKKIQDFNRQNRVDAQVLIVDEGGSVYSEILKYFPKEALDKSFVLEGGLSAFDDELERKKLIHEKKKITTSGQGFKCN